MDDLAYWVTHLQLSQHPEGGYYKETYRAPGLIPADALTDQKKPRNHSTGIYYLLPKGSFSAWHRIKSDEMWHFYSGGPLHIFVLKPCGTLEVLTLGPNLHQAHQLQLVVPANHWFAARCAPETDFTLAGCTVSPGFDFEDFELAQKAQLTKAFPQHAHIINELTRS